MDFESLRLAYDNDEIAFRTLLVSASLSRFLLQISNPGNGFNRRNVVQVGTAHPIRVLA